MNSLQKAEETALKLLRVRHSRRKLAEKLMRKGFPRDIVTGVCDKMEGLGYINDADYAEAFVHDCVMLHRYGPRKIRQALYQRGISGEHFSRAMDEVDEEIHLENLRFLLVKFIGGEEIITSCDAGRFYRKMENRGFLRSQIEAVLSEIEIIED